MNKTNEHADHKLFAPTHSGSVCPLVHLRPTTYPPHTPSNPHAHTLRLHAPRRAPRTLTTRCPAPRNISVRSPAPPCVPRDPSISFMMWMRHLIVTMVLVHPNTTLCTIEKFHVPEQQQMNKQNQKTDHKLYAPNHRGSVCPLVHLMPTTYLPHIRQNPTRTSPACTPLDMLLAR